MYGKEPAVRVIGDCLDASGLYIYVLILFLCIIDNAAGAAGGGAGWADFTNFETAFSSAGGVGGGGATNPSSSPSSSSGGFVGTASVGVKKEVSPHEVEAWKIRIEGLAD